MRRLTNVQVRLKVNRAHAAAAASLNYWDAKLGEAEAELEALTQLHLKDYLKKKTWCGGFKYNEETARAALNDAYWMWRKAAGFWAAESKIERLQTISKWLHSFVRSTADKEGFMVILTQEQYNWIWDEV